MSNDEENSEANEAEETPAKIGNNSPMAGKKGGKTPSTGDVGKPTSSGKKSKDKPFRISGFRAERKNPLALLKPLTEEFRKEIASLSFVEPVVETIDLATLKGLEEYRIDETLRLRNEELNSELLARNKKMGALQLDACIKIPG